MKKISIILLAAVSMLLFSCAKEAMNENETVESTESISFNLTASHPDTKAVKTNWEDGDVVFVFFSGASAPNYLKMSFNGSAWINLEYSGSVATPGALGLSNGDTGTMRAVYLPFGNTATVSADGTSYVFSTTYYTYYLTATLDYTVTAGEVSGSFEMVIPDNYVQFFVDDADAVDEAYALQCDAIIPTGIASIGENVAITETSDKTYANDIPGYAYDNGVDPKGYLFSGKINGEYAWAAQGYYFAKKKVSDGSRHDYFVTGKTLSSHNAIKLPANGDAKWIAVGIDKTIEMLHKTTQASLGIWYTCNFDQTVPEERGPSAFSWSVSSETRTAMAAAGVTLPTTEQLHTLHDGCNFYWVSIRGNEGAVLKGSNGTFLFLRSTQISDWRECYYLGQDSGDYLYVRSGAYTHTVDYSHADHWYGVRGIYIPPLSHPEMVVNGKFTINASGDQVYFSQGNLQYYCSTSTPKWRFAEYQYDYLAYDNSAYAENSGKWIDLFAYGTSGYYNGHANYQPWKICAGNDWYSGSLTGNADWGYNRIENGGDTENSGWRTLTKAEWLYLFQTRANAASKYGFGSVNGTNGIILLPDSWTLPDGLSFTAGTSAWTNSYTAVQWVQMENSGAVFLPASGSCNASAVPSESTQNAHGFYRSSTDAYYLHFASNTLDLLVTSYPQYGDAVRLVKPAIE